MYIPTNPYNYIEQCGCYMCKHVFKKSEYDAGPEYFCTSEALPRPKCCSVAMDERCKGDEYDVWYEWKKGREVKAYGICKKFEESDDWYEDDV